MNNLKPNTMKSYITRLLLVLAWAGTIFASSCSNDDEMTEIMLDDVVLNFTRTAQEEQLDLSALGEISNYWHIYSPTADNWCFYERIPGRKSLYIGLDPNTTSSVRSTYIMVRSKNYTQRIRINQDNGSTDLPLSLTYLSNTEAGGSQQVTIEGYEFLDDIQVTVDAASQSWLSATRENDVITITAAPNTEPEKRSGKVTVTAIRTISNTTVEAVIEVNQGATGIPPYHIVLPTDWDQTWVYTAEADGKPIAQITKEFLCLAGVIKAQAIVVYPINDNGEVLISQGGYVAEILLESADKTINPLQSYAYTAPSGNVHGGTVKFLLSNYNSDLGTNSTGIASGGKSDTDIPTLGESVHFAYTAGTAAAAKELWVLDDQFMTEYSDTNAIETTVKPYLVEDNRGTDDNYTYGVVKIGCQYWLNGNLKAAHWNKAKNFEAIPLAGDGWDTGVVASFICVYNDANDVTYLDAENRNTYGVLYTYLAIGGFSSLAASGVSNADDVIADNLSPEGWIVPTLPECLTMGGYTGSMLACGRLDLSVLTPENNITGFNGRKSHYFYSGKFATSTAFDAQYQTRTFAGANACYWAANTTKMIMTKNRGAGDRINLVRCINNGAIVVR